MTLALRRRMFFRNCVVAGSFILGKLILRMFLETVKLEVLEVRRLGILGSLMRGTMTTLYLYLHLASKISFFQALIAAI
jgi:hypothetical protein